MDVQRAIVAEVLTRGNVLLAESVCTEARKWLTRHFTRFWIAAVSEVRSMQLWYAVRCGGIIMRCRLPSGAQLWAQRVYSAIVLPYLCTQSV